jgi:hypothetical protein
LVNSCRGFPKIKLLLKNINKLIFNILLTKSKQYQRLIFSFKIGLFFFSGLPLYFRAKLVGSRVKLVSPAAPSVRNFV